jgi:spermidine/putrescine transport system permease protein
VSSALDARPTGRDAIAPARRRRARGIDRLEIMPVSPWARPVRWLLRAWAVAVLGFLYLPIAFLIMFSFEDSKTIGFPIPGFSLRWYEGIPGNDQLIHAVLNSVTVALVVAVLATVIGVMAAFPLVRAGLRYPNGARILFTMPIMLPGILIGVGLLVFLASVVHARFSLATVIAGHLVLTTPFVILIVAARLQGFDRRLEWAAADLGADHPNVLRRVVLPLIAPAILAGALIAVTLSIDEFVVTFFTVGPQLTLPIYIYTQIKFGVTPEVNAIATVVMLGTVLVFGLAALAAMAGRGVTRRIRARGSVVLPTDPTGPVAPVDPAARRGA